MNFLHILLQIRASMQLKTHCMCSISKYKSLLKVLYKQRKQNPQETIRNHSIDI